jgi:hypothetical protein
MRARVRTIALKLAKGDATLKEWLHAEHGNSMVDVTRMMSASATTADTPRTLKSMAMAIVSAINTVWFENQLLAQFSTGNYFSDERPLFSVAASTAMTRIGGHIKRTSDKLAGAHYELSVSVPVVTKACTDGRTYELAGGLRHHSRLDVLQHIVEHELVHLLVALVGGIRERAHGLEFRTLASNLFGHTEHTHRIGMAAPGDETATSAAAVVAAPFNFRIGDRVCCERAGTWYHGNILAIHRKNADVLMAKDGKLRRVPVAMLYLSTSLSPSSLLSSSS